jgi:transcriptional regulator with XRE-family HTH domain
MSENTIIETDLTFNGAALKEKRTMANRRQTEIAAFLGVQPQSYRDLEIGKNNPSARNLAKLCLYFDCPITDFFIIPDYYFRKNN